MSSAIAQVCLRDMSYYMDVLCYCAGLIYQDESAIVNLWPLRSNTMEIPSLGKEFSIDGMGRYDDLSIIDFLHQMLQPSCMVAVAMGDKYIVHHTEVNTHLHSR